MVDYQVDAVRNKCPVREAEMTSFRDLLIYVGMGSLLIVLFFCYSWLHVSQLTLAYQIEQIKQENEALREQNRALALEQASLQSPQRIDNFAREKLGMVSVREPGIVLLSGPNADSSTTAALLAGDHSLNRR